MIHRMKKRVFDSFDRLLGPLLYHKTTLNFSWHEGKVRRPCFLLRVNELVDRSGDLDRGQAIQVQRGSFWKWEVEIPADWRHHKRWPEIESTLDYYLCDLEGRYPPNYLVYHCGTSANIYSRLSWQVVNPEALPKWHGTGPVF